MRDYTSIRLEITSHCNLKCDYCHNSEYSNRKDDMTTEEILLLISNIKNKYNINKILLTGGEPLIQKDICKIIKHITSLGIKADLVTNGTMLTETKIRELEEAGLKRIRISIDELGDISDLRSTENPNTLWNIAKEVGYKSDIEVCIHTVCSPSNVKELFNVYKKVLEVGAVRWRVFDLGYQGGTANAKTKFDFTSYYVDLIESTKKILEHYLSNNLKDVLDIEINNIFRTLLLDAKYDESRPIDIAHVLKQRVLSSPCDYVADHQLSIRSNGQATLCQYFHNTIFDFKKYNFNAEKTIKNQNEVIENELMMEDLKYCKDCKYCLVCNSGCRSRVEFLTGNIKDADPVACYLYPMIQKKLIPLLPEEVQKAYNSFINPYGKQPKYTEKDLEKFLEGKGY
ncbi:MAG: radical SAM protein [Clostridia bacterium]|nr:radical SAM protein [Clostridia bacterium]